MIEIPKQNARLIVDDRARQEIHDKVFSFYEVSP